jgi:integrase
MESFIRYRKASNHWNEASYMPNLQLFDRYCQKNYPDCMKLTQDMVDIWCRQRNTEENNSCRSRIYVVVSYIRYLKERGLTNIQEPEIPRKEHRTYIPHAFTQEELKRFFEACDNLPVHPSTQEVLTRKLMIPVFFRLLYSSGIRTNEARLLRMEDVDLERGILDIRYSKGHDQHYIVLHDSMVMLMKRYDVAIEALYPRRTYFFPARNGSFHNRPWVQVNFRRIWDSVNSTHAVPYELRHHYAIENINHWVQLGFGFNDKLLYLSKSMGHTTIESTKYYYSLVPGMSKILEDRTEVGFEWIVPEVDYEEANE